MRDANFLREHRELTRRYILRFGLATAAGSLAAGALLGPGMLSAEEQTKKPDKAGAKLDPYFTPPRDFRDVSRGKPVPHTLSEEQRREAGLTRDTWRLEVVADPDNPARLGNSLAKADGTALDFAGLLELGQKHAVRFAKVMTCLNLGCPLGMGLWEGVPLREVVWLAKPREKLRRVIYYGYHNDDPKQMFRSSLPIGRVLEDPRDFPPVILCYKLNGEWLDAERGGPVRVVVPEAYGFKSIKWLTQVLLSDLPHANDTYADAGNDVDSPLKTFAATLSDFSGAKAGEPLLASGYAQVGVSGLSKVQVWVQPSDAALPAGDNYFTTAPWRDVDILPPPKDWGALPGGRIPAETFGFDAAGVPTIWPLRLAKIHWATAIPALPAGEYTLRSRTIDAKGIAQPLPRPFRKSGHAAIEAVTFQVK
jgi:DMSO/TMAO reductase YedYZ molybdopterin-dependent catalytic subunit